MAMIYLIRHGQASFLKSDYDQLSELGEQQSSILGQAFSMRNQRADLTIRGSLNRHEQTATHCLKAIKHATAVEVDARWNEYDHMELLAKYNEAFTDHEAIGKYLQKEENPKKALQQALNDSILDWIGNKRNYNQTWATFKEEAQKALYDLAAKLEKGQSAWVFTSGGPISALLIDLLSLRDEQFVHLQGRLVNSSITKIIVGKGKCTLSTYNEYSHLDHETKLITYR